MNSTVRQIDRLTAPQVEQLCELYQRQWWSKGRAIDDVRQMLDHGGLAIGLVDESDRLVGFCRVLTDFTFRAMLYDVIVDEAWRGQGLGRQLIEAVVQHPRLQRVSRLALSCVPELREFYEKWGFTVVPADRLTMERVQRPG